MRYAAIDAREFDYYDPDGRAIDRYVTQSLPDEGTFGTAVHRLVRSIARPGSDWALIPNLLMTTEECWSGYSEFTITNQWSEIVLTIPDWNWEQRWPSVGEFLRAVADANPEADR